MDMSLLTPQQVEEFTKEAEKLGLTLAELIAKRNELSGKSEPTNGELLGVSKGNTDIFGFTQSNWEELFNNLSKGKVGIDEMVFAVSALSDMYGKYSAYLDANENASLKKNEQSANRKKQNLKRQLDAGYINQTIYNRRVEEIDKDLDKKKADIEYRQAKRQKVIAAMNVLTSTAQAIIGIWAQAPKYDGGITAGILTGFVSALGALQLATVLASPLPAKGYEKGLYPEYVTRQQDGKSFKAGYQGKVKSGMVNKTSYFMVAENGPEMVIDNKAWRQISPETQNLLIRELQGIKGFEKGYYKDNVLYSGSTPTAPNQPSNNDNLLVTVITQNNMLIAENTAVLKEIRDKQFIATMDKRNLRDMKDLNDGIKDYNALRNRNKL